MIRGLNSPVRNFDQAKAEIAQSRREQFAQACPAEKRRLVQKWIAQAAVEIRQPDNTQPRR